MVSDFPNIPTNRMRFRLPLFYQAFLPCSLDLARNSVLLSVDIAEYLEIENKLFDWDGLMLFTATSCSITRDLKRMQANFEVTAPTYTPSEFRSRLTLGTFDLDSVPRKNMNIWTIPTWIPEAGSIFLLLNMRWHFSSYIGIKRPYCKQD